MTGADGTFLLEVEIPLYAREVEVTVELGSGLANSAGRVRVEIDHLGGACDVGILTLAPRDSCQPSWLPTFGGRPGVNSTVYAMTVFDDGRGSRPALHVGGDFTEAGGAEANRIAKWDGKNWSALGTGTNGSVRALTVFDDGRGGGPALYAGGVFDIAGRATANHVARWDGTGWTSLADGLDDGVLALTVFDDGSGPALYAGGSFTTAGGAAASHIAKWDGTRWTPLASGLDGPVHALTVFDDGIGPALYAGGDFTTAGGAAASRIAKWDGTSWSPLGTGLNSYVLALTVFDDGQGGGPALFAGGYFYDAGGSGADSVAKWDGTSWSPLGSGVNGSVHAMTVFDAGGGPALCVAGLVPNWPGHGTTSILAMWDGASWSPVPTGERVFHALAVFDDGRGAALHAGGIFTLAGGYAIHCIARWDGARWSPLGRGLESHVTSATVFDDGSGEGPKLHVGGFFLSAAGESLRFIGRWDGTRWEPLGSGVDNPVSALTVFDDGTGRGPALFAGGVFSRAGGVLAHGIAKWDGRMWAPLGSGVVGWVGALTAFDDGRGGAPALYAAGYFTSAGGVAANNIARWDGTTWAPLGSGTSNAVACIAVFDDGQGGGPSLYVGGSFSIAGGIPATGIAKWNGRTWAPLGSELDGGVSALTVFDDGTGGGPALYAGGTFSTAGGIATSNIAKWNGTSWTQLGSGVNHSVLELAVFDDGMGDGAALYAGGAFSAAGGLAVSCIARWDGTTWSPLGSGGTGLVLALSVFDSGNGAGPALYAGGFLTASDSGDRFLSRWQGCADSRFRADAPQQSRSRISVRPARQ